MVIMGFGGASGNLLVQSLLIKELVKAALLKFEHLQGWSSGSLFQCLTTHFPCV